jgi:hypothetical protein
MHLRSLGLVAIVGAATFAALPSCNAAAPPAIDCSTTTVKTYAQISTALDYCTDCHSSNRAAGGYQYDTYAAAAEGATAAADSIADGSMPQGASMPTALATDIYTWAQCGTPQ